MGSGWSPVPRIAADRDWEFRFVGDFQNAGRAWQKKGQPVPVRVHDFLIPEQGKAIPHSVYDLTRDEGFHGDWNYTIRPRRRL